MEDTQLYFFEVTGGFEVKKELKPSLNFDESTIVGFELPDGRIARPCIALEVESEDGKSHEYITSESEMSNPGLEGHQVFIDRNQFLLQ